jgi:hypothetical protein
VLELSYDNIRIVFILLESHVLSSIMPAKLDSEITINILILGEGAKSCHLMK